MTELVACIKKKFLDMCNNFQLKKNRQFKTTIFILSFSLFLSTQFYSIYFRLHKHDGPLGLDDSSYYISRIAYFKEHSLFERSTLFSLTDSLSADSYECIYPYYIFYGVVSSFTLGKLAALMNISAEEMFHFNFYIGILMISFAFLFLFKKVNKDPLFVTTGFVLLMFYTGNNNYHGFFWVVPSFYSLLFLLINIIIFFYTKKWATIAPFSIFFLLFSHPLSLYCLSLLSFALFVHGLLKKSIKCSLYKIIFLCSWSIFFMGTYKLLYFNDLILPLFVEGVGFQADLSFYFEGFKDLWNRTPFFHYFFGIFSPLTIASLYYCIVKKEFILLSLIISSFIGLLLFCVIHPYGSRTFLYFESMLIIMYTVACYNALCFFLNATDKLFSLFSRFFAFISNSLIIFLCCCLFFLFMKNKLGSDAAHKFQYSLFFQSNNFNAFVNNYNLDKLYILDSMGSAFIFLHFDGYWDKHLISPCMLPSVLNFDNYKNIFFFGSNLKMYENKRKGISVFWPKSGKIVLKKEIFQPSSYRLILTDSNLSQRLINNIRLESDEGTKNITIISNGWRSRPSKVVYPDSNKYPKYIPPWYYILIRYLKNQTSEGFLIVRNTQQYYIDFVISSPASQIYLTNVGDNIFLNGSIELKSSLSKKSEYLLDIDWGSAKEINLHSGLSFGKIEYPLLWKDPDCKKRVQIYGEKIIPALYTLIESFQDIKAFQMFCPKTENFDYFSSLNR